MNKQLTLSHNRWFCGVCGGIAEFLGWPYNTLRFLWLAATLMSAGTLLIAYIVCALVFPKPPNQFDLNNYRQ